MKGKKTDLGTDNCPIARSLEIIGGWWSLLIVRDAFEGKQRFGEFQKSIGLAKNILSSRLKKLVEDGIFTLEADEQTPSISRYVLTERGRQLGVILVALSQWGGEHCFEPGEFRFRTVDANGDPVAKLELRGKDGRLLGPHEVRTVLDQKRPASRKKQAATTVT